MISMQASRLYPISDPLNVQAHQLWAACALYQATGQSRYWAMTATLYANMDSDAGGRRLYWPLANYDNPLWYGLMCMAQSGQTYNGLEADAGLNIRANGEQTIEEVIASASPAKASRLDVLNQLWANLLSVWVEYGERDPIKCAPLLRIMSLVSTLIFLAYPTLRLIHFQVYSYYKTQHNPALGTKNRQGAPSLCARCPCTIHVDVLLHGKSHNEAASVVVISDCHTLSFSRKLIYLRAGTTHQGCTFWDAILMFLGRHPSKQP
jgi:hypothetical protein